MTFGQKPVRDTKTEVSFRSEMGFFVNSPCLRKRKAKTW